MNQSFAAIGLAALAAAATLPERPGASEPRTGGLYDLVIAGGRVMDPASGFDGVAAIGVTRGVIAAVGMDPMTGRDTIDASGLVVAPGFIDVLSYDPNPLGSWNKIADGVTTALAMHGGSADPDRWYARYDRDRPPMNYGASYFHAEARVALRLGRYERATPRQIELLTAGAERALRRGALGISLAPEYVPGISAAEIVPLMHLARRYDVPVFFHARYSDMEEPGTNIDALEEIIGYARETGAAVHVDHLTSTGGTFSMETSLALLEAARRDGLDITACAYPYDFWATYLSSARFDPGWQSRFRIGFADLQLAGSSERLTERSFRAYRAAGKLAVAYAIPDRDVVAALEAPFVMIASDAILEPGFNNHPRASGTFARTLGEYVRRRGTLSLMDALARMTIQPARRLEARSEQLRRKGRLSAGMDADITIFDPATVADRATVEHPEYQSAGIRWVIVNGRIAKDPDGLRNLVRAGRPIRNAVLADSLLAAAPAGPAPREPESIQP